MEMIDKKAALKLCSDTRNPYHRIVREFLLTAPTVDAEPVRHGRLDEDKPLTNGDRIRAMTDEELAEHLSGYICDNRESGDCQRFKNCEECKLSWIRQEVSEDA